MRLRSRAGGLVLGASVLFLVGTNVQAGFLYVVSALLVGAVVAGVAMPAFALKGLRAELDAPREAAQGGEAIVTLRLSSNARGVRWSVATVDDHLEPTQVLVGAIGPGERVDVTTARRPARRGSVASTRIEVRTAAPFGVAERRRHLSVDAHTLVLPSLEPLGALPFIEEVATTDPGQQAVHRRGTGPEYLGVREYRQGDSMRHVHWGLTAKHGQVMVREFEQELTRRLAIVVDTARDAQPRGDGPTPLDRVCTAAASVAIAAGAHGVGARLVGALADGEVDVVGRLAEADMLRWLARLAPSGRSLASVAATLVGPVLRGVETAVVVLPAWADAEVTNKCAWARDLSSAVARVVAIVVAVDGGDPPVALADRLRAEGVEAYPWAMNEPLAGALGSAMGAWA